MEGYPEPYLLQSSRPLPEFIGESPFCPRKRVPFRAPRPPSWAPSKSCPRVSRIYHHTKYSSGPQLVSFKAQGKQDVLTKSRHYNSQLNMSYFEQCFEVCEKLGEGSFGEVFRVCGLDDGKMYAVKKSLEPFRGEWDKRQKLTEVEKHERLPHHSNCVRFHKAWEERGKLYIQTELCEMSLSEYADFHGKVPEEKIWRILLDLVKGLKHLHDHRLCHLDIKPANVFLGRDNLTCKVGDFGLCSSLDQGFADAVEGDSKYLAPELMSHQFGKPADIFSLGISLLELACDLELPSGGEKWHRLRNGHIPMDLTEGLSPELVDLLSRMMDPDPKLRPTVDDILSEQCVVLTNYRQFCYRACHWTLSRCKLALASLWALVVFFYGLFPVLKQSKVQDSGGVEGGGVTDGKGQIVLHNQSFSDEEDELLQFTSPLSDDGVDPDAKFNRSWIRHSPVKYPSRVYAGPPIPIDFSECGVSPVVLFSKPSPSASPRSNHTGSAGRSAPSQRSFNVEPRRLMEAFDGF